MNKNLRLTDEVAYALETGAPVVALESTIISHGMPYPQNVETAISVEEIVRKHGAVPATIAILDGHIHIGLTHEQIERLGKLGTSVTKASRRDIPGIIASKGNGATTVAATMICAALAKIKVFCTGGIGGVHRMAQQTMDISADLEELAHTPVTVVCAGAKSILDLGLTLEYLETRGVPVIGYQTDELPAFFTRTSGLKLVQRLDKPEEIAKLMLAKEELGYDTGVVVANPIPEEYSMDKEYIDRIIESSLKSAIDKGISGKELTPFLLAAINEATGGKSLESNIQLVYNNAKVSAQIAKEFSKLGREA